MSKKASVRLAARRALQYAGGMELTTEELGRRLAAARVAKGLSQGEVIAAAKEAEIPGLSPTMISEIENGLREPQLKALRWMCAKYAADLDTLTDPTYKIFSNRLTQQVERLTDLVADLAKAIAEESPQEAQEREESDARTSPGILARKDRLDKGARPVRSGVTESTRRSQSDRHE